MMRNASSKFKDAANDVANDIALEITQKMISEEQENHVQNFANIKNGRDSNIKKELNADFILAYIDHNDNPQHAERREDFERGLVDLGLRLEYEQQRHLCFVKIYANHDVLCRYCDIMKLRMPIKLLTNENVFEESDLFDEAKSWFRRIFRFALLDPVKFPPKEYKLSAEYSRDKDYLFNTKDENFFPFFIRVMIVDYILKRQNDGIQKLIAENVYSAAYPLHDGTLRDKGSTRSLLYHEWGSITKWIKVQPLDTIKDYFGVNFAIYFAWLGYYTYMLIPASIAGIMCFVYGFLTLSSNQLAKDSCSPEAAEIIMCPQCDKTCDYWRLNETCTLTRVTYLFDNSATIFFAIFMSIWSVIYLELWKRRTVMLCYKWGLATYDKTAEHPRPNYLMMIQKTKVKVKTKTNPVTRAPEPHVSFWKVRVPTTLFSFSIVALFTLLALATVFGVVLYRMSMITTTSLFGTEFESTSYKTFTLPAIAASMNLVFILILNYIYDWLAEYLTEFELLRTQSEFDDSLTLKIYLFQFVNYYASIFYIALIKGKLIGYPKKYNRVFGFRQEECAPGGCLMELCIQLAIIMIGKQTVLSLVESILPYFYKYWALVRIHTGLKQKDPIVPLNQWIKDLKLLEWTPRGLSDEYLEMVIQFGFMTLFVVAFPLAPFFALTNNIFEMRLDATKFLKHYRRPVPRRTRDIGVWARILDTLARISVTTNAFIIAFSSTLIPRLVYMTVVSSDKSDAGFLGHSLAYFDTRDFQAGTEPLNSSFVNVTSCRYSEYRNPPNHPTMPYKRPTLYWQILAARLAFVVIFQNAVSLIAMLVQWCASGIPRKLQDQIKREAFLTEELIIKMEAERAKKTLFDNKSLRSRNSTLKPENSSYNTAL